MSETLPWPTSVPLLWLEMAVLFVVSPIVVALVFGVVSPIGILLVLVLVALWLLWRTPDFTMRDLLKGPVLGEWKLIVGFSLLSAPALLALSYFVIPGHFLELFRYQPHILLVIMALYPLFSALPQEIIFRTLFFRRYGRLFTNQHAAIAANAMAFALAHLFFGNPITLALTLVGGGIFAWAYLRHHSTLLAVVLHSIAGQLIFTSGLGIFFYHGAIPT